MLKAKKTLLIIIWSITMQPDVTAQSAKTVETYNILSRNEYVWMPVIHYKGHKSFYAEARYNYEDIKTAAVYAGKNYSRGNKVQYSITPMAGVVFGRFNGISTAVNSEINYKGLNFSGQSQYTLNTKNKMENFFYNWMELSHSFCKTLYGGISLQQTFLHKGRLTTQAGLLFGFSAGKVTVPVYVFNPLSHQKSITVGLIAAWEK